MRLLTALVLLVCAYSSPARDVDYALLNQLKAIHTQWFKAFDSGNGLAMDRIEMPNLILVFPDGAIWNKKPRAGQQEAAKAEHYLENASIRQFGDAAVLTGILVTRKGITSREATTVVFVKHKGSWKIASAQWTATTK